MGSSLEYKYSVTKSPPGDYCYVKLWDSGPIPRADLRQKDESGKTRVASKGATPVFPALLVFWFPKFPLFHVLKV